MVKSQMQDAIIIIWITVKSIIKYIGAWEAKYNPILKYTEIR